MPIDIDKVVGASLPALPATWDADDVILYHLGIGAGVPPTDEGELQYCYEGNLKVLPSFAVVPVFDAIAQVMVTDGMQINLMAILHGEQKVTIHKPLPTNAKVTSTPVIQAVYDKGKGAAIIVEAETRDDGGDLLTTNRFTIFVRGEGGFGGESGPAPGNEPPAREPDAVVESITLPQQALLYRLSGDKNPLHADPSFAAMGGFDRPILHGLCTYGFTGRALLDAWCDNDVTKFHHIEGRFSSPVMPGDALTIRTWKTGDGEAVFTTSVGDRSVIDQGLVRFR